MPHLEAVVCLIGGVRLHGKRKSVWLKANFAVCLGQKRSRMVNGSFIQVDPIIRFPHVEKGSEHKVKQKALFGSKHKI